jgi:hypothetical protein
MHGAGAAQGLAAAVFGTGQLEAVAQRPEQRRIGFHIDLMRLAIHIELDHGENSFGQMGKGRTAARSISGRPVLLAGAGQGAAV